MGLSSRRERIRGASRIWSTRAGATSQTGDDFNFDDRTILLLQAQSKESEKQNIWRSVGGGACPPLDAPPPADGGSGAHPGRVSVVRDVRVQSERARRVRQVAGRRTRLHVKCRAAKSARIVLNDLNGRTSSHSIFDKQTQGSFSKTLHRPA